MFKDGLRHTVMDKRHGAALATGAQSNTAATSQRYANEILRSETGIIDSVLTCSYEEAE